MQAVASTLLLIGVMAIGAIGHAQDDLPPETLAAVSPDGRYTAYVEDGTLQIVDAETLDVLPIVQELLGSVTAVDWHPDSRTIAVGTELDLIYIWSVHELLSQGDAPVGKVLHHPSIHNEWEGYGINTLDWNHTGNFLLSAVLISEFHLYIWDFTSFVPVKKLRTGDGSTARWSNNTDILVIGTGGGSRLLDLADVSTVDQHEFSYLEWKAVSRPIAESAPDQRFGAFAWSSDDRLIAASTWFGDTWLIDTASGEGELVSQLDQSKGGSYFFVVTDVEFDSDDQIFYTAVVSEDVTRGSSQIVAWNAATKESVGTIDVPYRVFDFDFNESDGSLVMGFVTLTPADLTSEE